MTTTPPHDSTHSAGAWDPKYEFKAISLLTLGFGLVGLDRFIISPLFPVMQKDLGLNYQDMGLISASLALAWGCAAIFAGGLSDRIGRKKVLVPALLAFSLLVATSGLAAGLISLLMIRALMGFAEGAYMPASIVSTIEASKPSRIGMNVGIQQSAQPLVGLGLGPLIAVGLLQVLPSWHWVFGVVAVPGLILALVMAKVLRSDAPAARPAGAQPPRVRQVLRYRAVVVNALCLACYLGSVITLAAFLPSYLTDHLKLPIDQMAWIMSGQGLGSVLGAMLLPALSDRLGRKPVILFALVVDIAALWLCSRMGANPVALFGVVCVAVAMSAGAIAITLGPLTSGAVPPQLASSATGLVNGVGEILGGAVAPALAGALAFRFGIEIIPHLALAAICVAVALAVFGVREPVVRTQEQPA